MNMVETVLLGRAERAHCACAGGQVRLGVQPVGGAVVGALVDAPGLAGGTALTSMSDTTKTSEDRKWPLNTRDL